MTESPLAAMALLAPPQQPQPIRVQWLGCDLRTGRIVAELPALAPSGVISRRIGAATSTQFSLDLSSAPTDWERATDPGRTMIVALADDVPVWAAMALTRTGGSAHTVDLGCATVEAYFDRRYTRDHTWTHEDESSVIAAGLIGDTQVDGLGLTIDAPATGTPRDHSYADADDATVLSRLQDLMGVQGGPEFTVEPRWRAGAGPKRIEMVARVRRRIGVQSDRASARFTYPGNVVDYTLAESYEAGKGATVVRARGEGEGDDRHTSDDMVATDLIAAGWPRYEHRWTPSTSITSKDVLNSHAQSAVDVMRLGARVWSLQAVASKGPRLGRDWGLGDTIGLDVLPGRSPRHPAGVSVSARAWAWEWDTRADRISPIIAED